MDNYSDFIVSDSISREDYEILIKQKSNNEYISYCPQLNKLFKGNAFDSVYYEMDEFIAEHIQSIDPTDYVSLVDSIESGNNEKGNIIFEEPISFVPQSVQQITRSNIETSNLETGDSKIVSPAELVFEEESILSASNDASIAQNEAFASGDILDTNIISQPIENNVIETELAEQPSIAVNFIDDVITPMFDTAVSIETNNDELFESLEGDGTKKRLKMGKQIFL